jgi:hypothetical protein
MGQGSEYFAQPQNQEEEQKVQTNPYMDQSAVLRATLNSLAMMNVANVINSNKRKPELIKEEERITQDLKEMLRVQRIKNQNNKNSNNQE